MNYHTSYPFLDCQSVAGGVLTNGFQPGLSLLVQKSEEIIQNFQADLNSGTVLATAQTNALNSQKFQDSGIFLPFI